MWKFGNERITEIKFESPLTKADFIAMLHDEISYIHKRRIELVEREQQINKMLYEDLK